MKTCDRLILLPWLLLAACATPGPADSEPAPAAAPVRLSPAGADPLNTTYLIDDHSVTLHNGEASRDAAPGSASRVETRIVGQPARGDLDGDGDDDAIVWLAQAPGGSGTFYYLAAAVLEDNGFRGSEALWVGDRIAPRAVELRNGVAMANYTDRAPGQAMAEPPTRAKTAYLIWQDAQPTLVPEPDEGERLIQGWLTIGHEVRAFRPCGALEDAWLLGSPPLHAELRAAYRAALPNAPPYTPLFVTLTGRKVAAPEVGFGAAYQHGFSASRLVKVWPNGTCG